MRPLMHAQLVNGRTGDPAVIVETLFEGRTILLDLGDVAALPARKILHLALVFVSHAHVDHFAGFDRMLRLLVGREKTVRLFGPPGFIDRVGNKLHGFEWNLAEGYANDLVLEVTEVLSPTQTRVAEFRLKEAFAPGPATCGTIAAGVIYEEPSFSVAAALLEHRNTVSLAFAITEVAHLNIWKNRLSELGLPVGPWLRDLKQAVLAGAPLETPIPIGGTPGRSLPLRSVRDAVTVTQGQKIAYVTDAANTQLNRRAMVDLARGADLLFIEAAFARDDADLAEARGHLTTRAAGEIAREASVRRVEPFHFSPRYAGADARMLGEVTEAFTAVPPALLAGGPTDRRITNPSSTNPV
jgi:ribonuclease Z